MCDVSELVQDLSVEADAGPDVAVRRQPPRHVDLFSTGSLPEVGDVVRDWCPSDVLLTVDAALSGLATASRRSVVRPELPKQTRAAVLCPPPRLATDRTGRQKPVRVPMAVAENSRRRGALLPARGCRKLLLGVPLPGCAAWPRQCQRRGGEQCTWWTRSRRSPRVPGRTSGTPRTRPAGAALTARRRRRRGRRSWRRPWTGRCVSSLTLMR